MSVRALEIKITGDGSRGSVLIESDADSFVAQIEELGSAKAREFVLGAATKEGQLADDSGETLPVTHARCQPAAYRARYEVTARQ